MTPAREQVVLESDTPAESSGPAQLEAIDDGTVGTDGADMEPITMGSPPAPDTNVVTIDANGPYGEMTDPKYEGETVTFTATMSGGNPDDYWWRWDLYDNGVWRNPPNEIPSQPPASNWRKDNRIITHQFFDNNIGEVTVQAWDQTYVTTTGMLFGDIYLAGMYYAGGVSTWNEGLRITPKMDLTITQLGSYRYEPFPRHIPYRMGLWTATGTNLLAAPCMLSTAAGSNVWRYCSIAPVTLSAGVTYVISTHTQASNYRFFMTETAVNPATYNYINTFTPGYVYPSRYLSSAIFQFPTFTSFYTCGGADCLAAVDAIFEYQTPDILEAQADIWVDNVAPEIKTMEAEPSVGEEGTEVTLKGTFEDPGLDDTWESRWCSPCGCTSWKPVRKFSGGAKVLIYHTADLYIPTFRTSLIAACGPFCLAVDAYNFQADPMTLDEMMPYDVVIVDTYSGATPAGTGDLLADYMDAKGSQGAQPSGGVMVVGRGPYNPGMWQITGRYFTQQYSPIPYGTSQWLWKNLGPILIPDLFSGVTTLSAYPHSYMTTVNPGALLHARWNDNSVLLATKESPAGNGARAVGIPSRLMSGSECTGNCVQLMVNALKWASRQPDPTPLSMPLAVEEDSLICPDDHPITLTPEDDFEFELQVRDDDHGKIVPIGDVVVMLNENFGSGMMPPPGWFRSGTWWMDWIISFSNLAGGTSPEAWFVYYMGWGSVGYGRLYTGPVDTTGFGALTISFRELLQHFGGPYTLMVETATAPGGPWTPVWQVTNPTGYAARLTTFTTSTNIGIPTTYFSWTFYGDPWNLDWWVIDNIYSEAFESYTMEGLGTDTMMVTIKNVFPTVIVPPELQDKVTTEGDLVTFEGLELTDPALKEETESFCYRVDFDDGYVTDWVCIGSLAPPVLKVLIYHSLGSEGGQPLANALMTMLPAGTIIGVHDFLSLGAGDVSLLAPYDVVFTGINWAPFDGNAVGNVLADYADLGGNVIETVASFYTTCGWWGICGRWRNQGYTTLGTGGIGGNQAVQTIFDPLHPIIKGEFGTVTTWSGGIPVSMTTFTPGSTRLARYPSYPAAAYNDLNNPNPGLGRTVGLNVFYYPGYYGSNELLLLSNAIWWASQLVIPSPIIPTFDHMYGDNGRYDVDFQIVDDDMWWDVSGIVPVFNGSGDPDDWISHNEIRIHVNNADPVIGNVEVYVEGDLCLRLSGNKGNLAKLVMNEGQGGPDKEITLLRTPGGPEFACIYDLKISLKKTDGAFVKVVYIPTGDDGSNPSWIVEGYWPGDDPHKIHMVFDSKKGYQEKYVSFADLFLGVPINFLVEATDVGTDDLAFVWNWGDTTPHGIHLYANAGGPFVEGFSDESQHLFDQLPNRDPWFDVSTNEDRSPWGTPMDVTDIQQHTYTHAYYYYAMVTVLDDDNCDPYPSPYACSGTDMEFVEVNLV